MAPAVESQYKDLLNPVKDIEKSFTVNISELLQNFVAELLEGKTTPNFNSAALLLQGSASVYGKKVEYLHNLATQLHNSLLKQKKDEQQQLQSKKDEKVKEKQKKEEKLADPFLSVEIKLGKNLSCLKKKNLPKTNKKAPKKVKASNVPVHLLSNDSDERGDVFYDSRGELVGNKGDFAINKCRLLSSGWLLVPTVNPAHVPSLAAVPDYYDDSDHNSNGMDCIETGSGGDGFDDIPASSDEGFESRPESNAGANSEANHPDTPSEGIASSAPVSTDEGIEGTPNDIDDSPDTENIPVEGDENGQQQPTPAPTPLRQSVRQALRGCQLEVDDDPLAGITINKELLKRKAIEKKNVRRLPEKLKNNGVSPGPIEPIEMFCARTFFSMDDRHKTSLLQFDTESFDQNSSFIKRMSEKIDALKTSDKRNKNIAPIEDERSLDVDGLEVSRDANEDDETLCIPFDDNDIQIDHDEPFKMDPPPPLQLPEGDNAEPVPPPDMPSPDISHIAHEECENYMREVHQFVQNSDITQRVHEWEKSVKPFLDELDQRESFDINLYGSRILNSFEDNNRKQTMTFRQFCRNKEKWEIHRYFMALLPLANIGNVALESEPKEDGSEEIMVTLLSRKMHHKELEEFGHNDGSHA